MSDHDEPDYESLLPGGKRENEQERLAAEYMKLAIKRMAPNEEGHCLLCPSCGEALRLIAGGISFICSSAPIALLALFPVPLVSEADVTIARESLAKSLIAHVKRYAASVERDEKALAEHAAKEKADAAG